MRLSTLLGDHLDRSIISTIQDVKYEDIDKDIIGLHVDNNPLVCLVLEKVVEQLNPATIIDNFSNILFQELKSTYLDIRFACERVLVHLVKNSDMSKQVLNLMQANWFESARSIVFAHGMALPAEFYTMLNEMALNPKSRLQAWYILKEFLVVEVFDIYSGCSHLLSG